MSAAFVLACELTLTLLRQFKEHVIYFSPLLSNINSDLDFKKVFFFF